MDNMKTLRKWITMEMNSLEDGIVYDAARRTFKLVLDLMDLLEEDNKPQAADKEENLPGQMEMDEYLGE